LIAWSTGASCGASVAAEAAAPIHGNGFNGNGSGYSVDQIEQIVRKGPPVGKNRSDVFHTIVGHYLGCGWSAERILEHLQQFPRGIGGRYLREDRLRREIVRRLRLDAVVRAKCGGMVRAPFRWYETAPMLLHKGSVEMLIGMTRRAEASLQEEFGLPLGLVVISSVGVDVLYPSSSLDPRDHDPRS
jgi:hypothetical protein